MAGHLEFLAVLSAAEGTGAKVAAVAAEVAQARVVAQAVGQQAADEDKGRLREALSSCVIARS
jgi:hypothetical protein